MADREFLVRLTQELMDQGKLIEAGWVGFRVAVGLESAPKVQLDEMRNAFFAGSQHLFSSVLAGLEEGTEETEADLRRLSLIADELQTFIEDFERRHGTSPSATH